MQDISRQTYQNNNMVIRMEYEEEKRVFALMKWFLFILGSVTAIGVLILFLSKTPDLIAQLGATELVVFIPFTLFASIFAGFWIGTVPAGYIAAWRAIRRSGLFIWGNLLGLLLIATLFLSIPAAISPIAFLLQWAKVSRLKRQLGEG